MKAAGDGEPYGVRDIGPGVGGVGFPIDVEGRRKCRSWR